MTCMLLRVCEMTGWSVGEDWGPRGRGHDAVWGGGRLGGRGRPRPWPRRCVGWRTPWWEEASLSPVALFLLSLGASEGDTEAGSLTGIFLAPGVLGVRAG